MWSGRSGGRASRAGKQPFAANATRRGSTSLPQPATARAEVAPIFVSEGGVEPIAHAFALAAEFALGESR